MDNRQVDVLNYYMKCNGDLTHYNLNIAIFNLLFNNTFSNPLDIILITVGIHLFELLKK